MSERIRGSYDDALCKSIYVYFTLVYFGFAGQNWGLLMSAVDERSDIDFAV